MEAIFGPIYEAIGWLLAQLYSVVPNLGVCIILLTVIIMLILYPLTAKQARSMIAMQRVQPEIKKLQAKYKNDRAKLNEEMMAFYKENKINPLAGCLPLLVQMPIFLSLFQVLRNPEEWVPKDSDLYAALCTTADGVLKGVEACAKSITHLSFLGIDLQLSATDAHDSALDAAPYFFLVGLVILTGFLQTRQAQKRTPAVNKQMGMVMRVLPIFFGLISLQFPAGLVLYFFVSNLWRLGQQELIFRQFGSASNPKGAIDVASKDRGAKAKTAVAELDAPEDDGDDEPDAPAAPAPKASKPAPKPAQQDAPAPEAAATPARPSASRGGLRGLFQLPPPPEPNGGGAPTAAKSSAQRSSSSSGTGRPPQQRRKRNKKKRKR